jgi:hypothetical protein
MLKRTMMGLLLLAGPFQLAVHDIPGTGCGASARAGVRGRAGGAHHDQAPPDTRLDQQAKERRLARSWDRQQ